jgi:hypothetical protein
MPACASVSREQQRRIETLPPPLRANVMAVRDGKTTKDEIRAMFGAPDQVSEARWVYNIRGPHGEQVLLNGFPLTWFIVYFDKSGIVERHTVDGPASPCFIATAVYGSDDCRELVLLRQFRDAVLLKWPMGRAAVAVYYRFSPGVADWLRARPMASRIVRRSLDVLVRRLETRS